MKLTTRFRKALAFLLSCILLLICCAVSPLPASAASSTATVSVTISEKYSMAYEVLSKVNTERRSQGLSSLSMDKTLLDAAMLRAAEIVVDFSHTRPNGESCFTAYSWTSCVGENIAKGQTSSASVMNSWMNSSGHKANILGSGYTKMGVGCAYANGTYYWVQIFSGGTATAVTKPADKTVTRKVTIGSSFLSTYIPSQPTISSTSVGLKSATIRYNAVSGANGYRIYRYNTSTKTYEALATVGSDTLQYTDKNRTPGVTYTYKVRAYRKTGACTGWSVCSAAVKLTPKPARPTIQSYATTQSSIRLRWNKVSCTGYYIYRLNSATQKYERIGKVKADTLTFTDTGLQSGRSYRYRVQAYYATASGIYAESTMSAGLTIQTK